MPLNLITDQWIPVLKADGQRQIIAPWQMADPDILRPDWPRADLNIGCYELLIGLVFMADPPAHNEDWQDRCDPNSERLRSKLAPFAPAFNLTGNGPLFMQDLEPLQGEPNTPDMLFIDSAGGQTAKNNADLMVWRGRYPALEPALAAMALYTFQSFAPSGGAGNRTSMRGGGPLVTLIQPHRSLWPTVWANVPDGQTAELQLLPWMRKTRTSESAQQLFPQQSNLVEALFGMPRRLRLVETNKRITGVIQRPYGTNYAGWDHPLTPYYRQKVTEEWLPKHPRAGLFGYRNWAGIVIAKANEHDGTARRATVLRDWRSRSNKPAQILVAGWAMDNMKPRDFILSTPPFVDLGGEALSCLTGMIEAAEQLSLALRDQMATVLAKGESREAVREEFFARTQVGFEQGLAALTNSEPAHDVARRWISVMKDVAINLFEARALPGLADRDTKDQEKIVQAHRNLLGAFAGKGKLGRAAFAAMEITDQKELGL